jgi:hypothetical protein
MEEEDIGGDGEERQMGPEVFYVAEGEIDCPCGQHIVVTRNGSEYPQGSPIDWDEPEVKGGERV